MMYVRGYEVWHDKRTHAWRWRAYCEGTTREGTGVSEAACRTQAAQARDALMMERRLRDNNRSI